MPANERQALLSVLDIDEQSLLPKTEQAFLSGEDNKTTLDQAKTLYRYHQNRLIFNYKKIYDYMKEK